MARVANVVTLVELMPWDPELGTTVTLYYASRHFVTSPTDTPANMPYLARVEGGMSITATAYEPGKIGGSSVPDVGSIRLHNADGYLDEDGVSEAGITRKPLEEYTWDGRRVRVLELKKGSDYSTDPVVYDGTATDLRRTDDFLELPLRGDGYQLSRAAQSEVYGAHAVGLYFNDGAAATDFVTLPNEVNPLELSEWTLEFWCMVPRGAVAGTSPIFFRDLTAGWQVIRVGEDGSPSFGGLRIGNAGLSTKVLADGLWHHIAIVSREGTQTGIVDGVSWGSVSGIAVAASGDGVGARIGSALAAQHWEGGIAGYRIWGTALGLDLIRGRRYSSLVGNEAHLRTNFKLNEGMDLSFDGSVVASPEIGKTTARADAYVFDSAASPLGTGYGTISGTPEWIQTGELWNHEQGRRKPLPLGRVRNWEPDASDPRSNYWTLSSTPIHSLETVRTGGRALGETAQLEFAGTTGRIVVPDDAGLDWANGEARTFAFEFDVEDNSADQFLLEQTNGSSVWRIKLVEDGGLLQVSTTFANNSGSSVTLGAYLSTQPTGAAQLDPRKGVVSVLVSAILGGPLVIYVNGVMQGSATMPAGPSDPGDLTLFNDEAFATGFKGRALRFALYEQFADPEAAALTTAQSFDDVLDGLGDPAIELLLDDGSGTTATDTGTVGSNGTITGGTWVIEDYELINGPGGAFLRTANAPAGPLRVDLRGTLPYGHCVTGTGSDTSASRVTVADDASLRFTGSASWHFRYRHADPASDALVFRKSFAGEGSWDMRVAAGTSYLRARVVTDAGTQSVDTADMTDGRWYDLGLVFDNSAETLTLYVDGVQVDQQTSTGQVSTNVETEILRFLAGPQGQAGHHFAFVGRALTAAEIRAIGADPWGELVGDDDLIGYWPGNENSGTTVHDLSPNQNHGTLTGADMTWTQGWYPETAGEIAQWCSNRAGLHADRQDRTSFDDFDTCTSSAPVQALVREQDLGAVLDEAVKPVGLWGVDATTRLLYLDEFRAPDVGTVPEFDGTIYAEVASRAALDKLRTAEVWVRRRVFDGGVQTLMTRGSFFWLEVNASGELSATWVDPGNTERTYDYELPAAQLEGDAWVHVAVTRSGLMYVDGVAVTTTDSSTSGAYQTTAKLRLGGSPIGTGTRGALRGAVWWNTERTATEIANCMHLHPQGDEYGLIDAWDMDEDSGTVLEAVSGTNGTYSAAPTRRLSWVPSNRRVTLELFRSTRTLDHEDGAILTVRPAGNELPAALARVEYARNQTPYNRSDLLGIVLEDGSLVEALIAESQIASRSIPSVETDHLLPAVHPVLESALVQQTNADRAVELVALNHGRRRRTIEVDAWGLFNVRPGTEVRLQADRGTASPRWRLPRKGANFVVLQARRDSRRHVTTFRLWG